MSSAKESSVRVASLGLFILDTFEWRDADNGTVKKHEENVIGGGGTYCIIGSRQWLAPEKIGIIVDRGTDWSRDVQAELDAFGPMWHYREADRPTTAALNLYTGEHRDFKYLNERTRLEPIDLPPSLRSSAWLHCVCSPERVAVIHTQLSPPLNTTPNWSPTLVYEPIPDRCVPEEMSALVRILPSIGVFSPNHEEAWSFFGVSAEEANRRGNKGIEEVAQRFLDIGAQRDVVVRSGALGAFCLRRGQGSGRWVDAYHRDASKVVDVTGAGNSFMGGLMSGLELHPDNLVLAAQMGSVSASFTIEQYGLPRLSSGSDGQELWNGELPSDRLAELQARSSPP